MKLFLLLFGAGMGFGLGASIGGYLVFRTVQAIEAALCRHASGGAASHKFSGWSGR